MNVSRLKGSIPPLITPFRNGAVDYDAYGAMVEFQTAEDGIIPLTKSSGKAPGITRRSLGSPGESSRSADRVMVARRGRTT